MESNPFIVSEAPASDRVAFFKRTYLHVAGAFAAFGALLYAFFVTDVARSIMQGFGSIMGSMGGFGILVVMLMFWGGTYVAQKMAENRASRPSQYLGLGLYVVLEAIIFVPLIVMVAIKTLRAPDRDGRHQDQRQPRRDPHPGLRRHRRLGRRADRRRLHDGHRLLLPARRHRHR